MNLKAILTASSVATTLLLTPNMIVESEEEPPAIESVIVQTQEKLETAGLIGTRLPFLGEYDLVFEDNETLTEEMKYLEMDVEELKNNLKEIEKEKKSMEKDYQDEIKELKSKNSNLQNEVNKKDSELREVKSKDASKVQDEPKVSKSNAPKKSVEVKSKSSKQTADNKSKDKSVEEVKTTSKTSQKATGGGQTFEATYYGMDCSGCSGTTASGLTLSSGQTSYQGMRVIAVDPNVIPFHSIVEITHNGSTYTAVAKDSGGAIKGNRIDILTGSEAESSKHGRYNVQLKVISKGNGAYKRE